MARIALEILRGPYKAARPLGVLVEQVRLLADVHLWTGSRWTPSRPAIVDTGAPLSLFPRRFWRQADVRALGRVQVGGVRNKPECMLEVGLGVVTFAISDGHGQSEPIETHALLADIDDVPPLLGIRGALTVFTLHVDLPAGNAYLESSLAGEV